MGQGSPSFNVKCLGPALHLPKHHLHSWMKTIASRGNWGKEYNKSNLQEYFFCSILIPFSNNQQLKGFQRLWSIATFLNLILPGLFKPLYTFYLSIIFICNNEFHVTGKVFLWQLFYKFIIWKQDIFFRHHCSSQKKHSHALFSEEHYQFLPFIMQHSEVAEFLPHRSSFL